MQRFSLSVLALCLFVAALAAALPAQDKRGFGDEAFHMANEFEDDPAFQTGGIGTGVVITPTNGPQATPAPASSAPAKAHAPNASSSSSSSSSPASASASPSPTPTPTSSKPVSGTTVAFGSTAPDATPTPSDKKDSESFLQEIPVIGDAMEMLTGGRRA